MSAARELETSGFKREQAEAIAAIVRAGQGGLATKADIKQMREQLAHKIEVANTQLRGEVKQDIAELRGEVKQDIAQLEVRLAWRLVAAMGMIIAANAGMLALFKFIG